MTRATQPEAVLFGQRLRELRQKRRLTQAELAAAAGLTSVYISNMESGVAVPSLTTVLRLAAGLECRVSRLVTVFDAVDIQDLLSE